MTSELWVGASSAIITPALGIPMGGYGAREGAANSIHDDLRCQVVVFSDRDETLVLAVCDLLFITTDLSNLVRSSVRTELGINADHVMVCATHTHSGPAGLTARQSGVAIAALAQKITGAIVEAFERRQPAIIKVGRAELASVAQNRRHPGGPIERAATILSVQSAFADNENIATIVNYACHPTVLEYDNLAYSRDFPGEMVDLVEGSLGGTALYVQGCAGDINPVWMRHDFAEASRLGGIIAAVAVRTVYELRPAGQGQWAVNLSWKEPTEKRTSAGEVLSPAPLAAAIETVTLLRRPQRTVDQVRKELEEARERIEQVPDLATRRMIQPLEAALEMELYYSDHPYVYAINANDALEKASSVETAEVQAFRLGDGLGIVAIPGEPFVDIGAQIRQSFEPGRVVVAGYGNQAIGYIPTARQFPLYGYEVGCARFTPLAASQLVTAATSALGRVGLRGYLSGEEESNARRL